VRGRGVALAGGMVAAVVFVANLHICCVGDRGGASRADGMAGDVTAAARLAPGRRTNAYAIS